MGTVQQPKPVQMDIPGDANGLTRLLDRIAHTDGEINPNDRAIARIYVGYMTRQAGLRRRSSDRKPTLVPTSE